MDVNKIIQTIGLVGSNLPAFVQLFDQVVDAFGESDQTKLRAAYDKAMLDAEAQHKAAQAL